MKVFKLNAIRPNWLHPGKNDSICRKSQRETEFYAVVGNSATTLPLMINYGKITDIIN
jgi:hypothetical protein